MEQGLSILGTPKVLQPLFTEEELMALWYEEELKQKAVMLEIPEDFELKTLSQLSECHSR